MKVKSISACIALLLSGCMGVSNVTKIENTGTYSVSGSYGSINGSWGRASQEASQTAVKFCRGMNMEARLINEDRSGIFGVTPQVSTITFECVTGLRVEDVSGGS